MELQTHPPRRGHSVLLVNLPPSAAASLTHRLRRAGHVVDHAADTGSAIDRLQRKGADLVMASIHRVNTVDAGLAAHLRALYPGLPLVLVGDPLTPDYAATCLNDGAAGIIPDPEDEATVLHLVRSCLFTSQTMQRGWSRLIQERQRTRSTQRTELSFDQMLGQVHLRFQPVIRASTGEVAGYDVIPRVDAAGAACASLRELAIQLGREVDFDERISSLIRIEFEDRSSWHDLFTGLNPQRLLHGETGTEDDRLWPFATRLVLCVDDLPESTDEHRLQRAVDRARRAGYRLSIGALDASRQTLQRMRLLSPEFYRVGPEVLAGCTTDPRRRMFLEALVRMAHAEGATVLAQGLADQQTRDVAVECGCDFIQGDLLGAQRSDYE